MLGMEVYVLKPELGRQEGLEFGASQGDIVRKPLTLKKKKKKSNNGNFTF